MPSQFIKAAKASDIPDGAMTSVTVEGEEVLIACVSSQYYAIRNKSAIRAARSTRASYSPTAAR